MANLLFKECDGRVVRVPTRCNDDSTLFRIKLNGRQIWLPVTGFALDVGGNYQFLHTLSDFVYFYGFGERVGELTVTGMAFIKRSCRADDTVYEFDFWNSFFWVEDTSSGSSRNEIGFGQSIDNIQNLWDIYTNSPTFKGQRAIKITWGNVEAFWGFLTGMRVEIARPDIPIAQYTLRFNIVKKNL